MIATLEYGGFTIFNHEIGLKLSDKVRLEDVRHIYSHDIHNNKQTINLKRSCLELSFTLIYLGLKSIILKQMH